jgi:hypothetical protein
MNRPELATQSPIPGYGYGTAKSATSPVTEAELHQLEQTAGWTADDLGTLARHAGLVSARAEAMVDSLARHHRFATASLPLVCETRRRAG